MTSWRQLYYDDAQSLATKYDLVNQYDVRGIGIWALGYDGSRPELYAVIKDKFIVDTIPPEIISSRASSAAFSPNGDGRLDAFAVRVKATGLVRFGWRVQPFIDGTADAAIIQGEQEGSAPHWIWDGRAADGRAAPGRRVPGDDVDGRRLQQPIGRRQPRHDRFGQAGAHGGDQAGDDLPER